MFTHVSCLNIRDFLFSTREVTRDLIVDARLLIRDSLRPRMESEGAALLAREHFRGTPRSSPSSRRSTQSPLAAPRNVCGTIVRLLKYLMSDYFADYFDNLQDIVKGLTIVQNSPTRSQNMQKWRKSSTFSVKSRFSNSTW